MKKRLKPLLHITAKTRNDTAVDLFYYSKKQATYFNPGLRDFEEVGYEKDR